MTTDIDIYRSAKLLIDQHGQGAVLEVVRRADALRDEGNLDGQAVWLRVGAAVLELLESGDGETVLTEEQNIQRLSREVAEQREQLEALEASETERQKNEMLEAVIKTVTAIYTSAKAYANVIIIAGYVAFFTTWGFVRADISKTASFWALLLTMFSVAVLVFYEIFKMIWVGWSIRRSLLAHNNTTDPLGRLHELEKTEQLEAKLFGKVWIFVLVLTILPAVTALGVLATNIILALMQEPSEFPHHIPDLM